MFAWGRRASDEGAGAPAVPHRDIVLEAAIAHESIEVLYQPLLSTMTAAILGVEALARSEMAPSADILFRRAAAANLSERLSRLVQRKALRSAAIWEGPLKTLAISINCLPCELSRSGYDDWLLGEISAAGLNPRRVTVEITESALLSDHAAVAVQLASLRAAGVRIAIDDFGTGYASLSYLAGLPLDAIKIDRGLITHLVTRKRDRIVLDAIVQLARDLDLSVVVEGVETPEQLALLKQYDVDSYQGFLGAGALTLEELTRFAALTAADAELRPAQAPSGQPSLQPLPPATARARAAARR